MDSSIIPRIIKLEHKLATLKNRKIFLLKCRQFSLIPHFLQFKTKHLQFDDENLARIFKITTSKFQNKILGLLISDCVKSENGMKKIANHLLTQVNKSDNNFSTLELLKTERTKIEAKFILTRTKQKKKIQMLINRKQEEVKTNLQYDEQSSNWLINLSKQTIPKEVQEVLKLGPKFALQFNNKKEDLPVTDILASIEQVMENKDEEIKTDIRIKVCNTIKNFCNKPQHKSTTQKEIDKKCITTKSFLKRHPNLLILEADKSKQTVIMDRPDYEEKMDILLKDTNTYMSINKDMTAIHQKNNNSIVNKWAEELKINLQTKSFLKINNSLPPRIYGLPKTHKINVPLRPIVNFIQSPFYNMSKYLAQITCNIVGKTNNTVTDSWEFVDYIKSVNTIPTNHVMISLDVVSLYTNTPIDIALDVLKEKWSEIKRFTSLDKDDYINAINTVLSSSYFSYNKNFYKQVYGVPMGAPLSPIIANLVLEKVEEEILNKLKDDVFVYKRYVDDVFLVVKKDSVTHILQCFNSFHHRIQFTLEQENNRVLNFLDVAVTRNQCKLSYNWYTKPSWTGRYLNFFADLPSKYKKSTISALSSRALRLTTPQGRERQLNKVRHTMSVNNYPLSFTNKVISKEIHKIYNGPDKSKKNKDENIKRVSFPYIKSLSEKIDHILKPHKIEVIGKNQNNLKRFFSNTKDKRDQHKLTHVIYKIPCLDCNSCYIGQTKQYLSNRIRSHSGSVSGKNKENTALKNHTEDFNHHFDFNNVAVLDKENNEKKRLFKEMVRIKTTNHTVNDRTDYLGLSKFYYPILC